MKKLKIFLSICLLSSTLPTSVLASYTLDQDANGVDIADVVKAIQDPQAMRTITGKNIFDQADIRNLLRQIQSSNQEASLGTITGFVTDETGAAVNKAEIKIEGTSLQMQTNELGYFQFNDVPITYQTKVEVTKEGYATASSELFNIWSGDTRNLSNLILRKIPTYGSVSGYVYGPDQHALASALVSVDDLTTPKTVLTNSSGYFFLSEVPTGNQSLTVTKDTYTSITQAFNVTKDNLTTIPTLQLAKVVSPQLTGSIRGVVTSSNNQPLSEALVSVTGTTYSIPTDNNGSFTLSNIPVGIAELHILKEGFQPLHIPGITVSEIVYDTGTIRLSPAVVLKGSISGKVTSTTGSNLASVQIRVKGTEITEYTDVSGNFTINNLPVGSHKLQISAENYIGQDISVNVLQAGTPPVSVSLTHQTANVQGYARSTTGEIIAYTQATIPGTSYSAYVNESGQFTFYNLPVGYTIQEIVIADYQPKLPLTAITVTPNLNSIGTLEFQPLGTITGVVRASDATNNNPVLSNVTVTLQAIGDTYVQTTTSDDNGSFSFSHIPANASYTLTIEKVGYVLYPIQPFTVTKGQNYKYLYLQQGVAVTNESQLLAAYADTSVPYILLLNDIHLSAPFNFNRPISLRGVSVSDSNIKLTSPKFSISSAGVGWSGVDLYCEVGNDEMKLQGALYSFVGAIKLNGLGNYDGFIRIVSQKNYFITDGSSNLTAFVNNAEGLGNALANPDVSTIYVAENIYSYGNLNFPNRPIHFISQSEKTIQKDSYSNTSQVQLTNVRLLPEQ
ncbi:carboxypeptidase regulatory-like domain-containing protein [Paenibacillus sp. 2RAB27]|uniref:carboxypeptidase regulatory-like domain-containing protein n=1 Tax=Paenibacillus sp. 2RAB27 TaxID=3232991 RepID=UPI003F9B164A